MPAASIPVGALSPRADQIGAMSAGAKRGLGSLSAGGWRGRHGSGWLDDAEAQVASWSQRLPELLKDGTAGLDPQVDHRSREDVDAHLLAPTPVDPRVDCVVPARQVEDHVLPRPHPLDRHIVAPDPVRPGSVPPPARPSTDDDSAEARTERRWSGVQREGHPRTLPTHWLRCSMDRPARAGRRTTTRGCG